MRNGPSKKKAHDEERLSQDHDADEDMYYDDDDETIKDQAAKAPDPAEDTAGESYGTANIS